MRISLGRPQVRRLPFPLLLFFSFPLHLWSKRRLPLAAARGTPGRRTQGPLPTPALTRGPSLPLPVALRPLPHPKSLSSFKRLVSNQIPEATIREWDRLSLAEAAHDKVVANTKSLFLDMKIGEQVVDAARIDEGLRAELKQVKSSLATVTKDRDTLR